MLRRRAAVRAGEGLHPHRIPEAATLCILQAAQEKAEREGRLREQAEKSRLRREAQEAAAAAEAARRKTEAAEAAAAAAEAKAKVREQARAAAAAQSKLMGGGADAPRSPSLSAATDESLSLQGQTDSDASAGW